MRNVFKMSNNFSFHEYSFNPMARSANPLPMAPLLPLPRPSPPPRSPAPPCAPSTVFVFHDAQKLEADLQRMELFFYRDRPRLIFTRAGQPAKPRYPDALASHGQLHSTSSRLRPLAPARRRSRLPAEPPPNTPTPTGAQNQPRSSATAPCPCPQPRRSDPK